MSSMTSHMHAAEMQGIWQCRDLAEVAVHMINVQGVAGKSAIQPGLRYSQVAGFDELAGTCASVARLRLACSVTRLIL